MKKITLIVISAVIIFSANAQEKKYAIEKGKVVYKMEIMGSVNTMTMYFKEYGIIQATISEVNMMGITANMRTIERDGFVYNLNLNNKTGIKTLIDEEEKNGLLKGDIDTLSDEQLTEYEAKREGTEVIAGKKATVYTLTENGSKNTFCIWKNIPLKWEAEDEGIKITTKAIEVSENPSFPEGVFEIPKDYEISDMPKF